MEKFGEKLISSAVGATEFVSKHASKMAIFVTIIIVQVLLLGSIQRVSAQEDICISSKHMYSTMGKETTVTTGDPNASIDSTKSYSFIADVRRILTLMGGTNCFCGAEEMSVEYDLPMSSKVGLVNTTNNTVMALVYDPPGIDIPSHLAREWIPGESTTTSVYAQAEGYEFLRDTMGLEPIWKIFRNIAYAGFVLIIVVAGFMVMFRQKIGGQISIGIMNTIPGVVLGLILVTFSFALVGFFIDLSRLMSVMVTTYMETALTSATGEAFEPITLGNNFFAITIRAFTSLPAYDNISDIIAKGDFSGVSLTDWIMYGFAGFGAILAPVTGGMGIILSSGPAIIMIAIFGICLWASIKLFAMLISTYIKILVDLIFGPIYILVGSLPGKGSAIGDWIKRLAVNCLVFPFVTILINVARFLGTQSQIDTSSPLSFFAGGDFKSVEWIISMKGILVLGIYFIAAGAPSIIEDSLGLQPSRGVTTAVEGAKKSAAKIPVVGGLFGSA